MNNAVLEKAISQEDARLKALASYKIVGTPPEDEYDDLTRLAALICEAPASVISLITEDQQVFKSVYGIEGCGISREEAICNHTIKKPGEITIIEETRQHPLTQDNNFVHDSGIVFYAGYPLVDDDGYALGTICVIDWKKRSISKVQKESLRSIANQIVQLFKLRKKNAQSKLDQLNLASKAKRFESIIEATNVGTWEWHINTGEVIINERYAKMLGYAVNDLLPFTFQDVTDLIHPQDVDNVVHHAQRCMNKQDSFFNALFRLKHKSGKWITVYSHGKVLEWNGDQPVIFYGSHTDVTKEQIIESQLNTLSENLPAILYKYQLLPDGTDRFIYASKSIEDVWEVTREQALENSDLLWNKVFPQDAENLKQSILESAKNFSVWMFEWRMFNSKGEIRWNRGKARPTHGDKGSIIFDGIIFDVTDEKKLEIELYESNKKLKNAQEISNLGYWELDLTNLNMAWSDQVYRIFETSEADFTPNLKNIEPLIHPEDRDYFRKELYSIQNGSIEFNFEHRILLTDGSEKWVRQVGKVINNYKGESALLEATIQDITSQKLTSLELKETLQKYIHLDKATSDTMWDWRMTEDSLYWSENYTNNFGHEIAIDPTENMRLWEDHIHPEDKEGVLNSFRSIAKNKDSIWIKEYRFKKKNGEYAYILDKGFVIRDENQAPVRVIGAMQDLSEIKKKEQLLLDLNKDLENKARELSSSNEELEQFAYVASHDLQEPLRMITSFLSLLETKYGDQLDDKAKKYIHFAVDGSKRMKEIILDLLDYSTINRLSEQPQNLDLNDIIQEVQLLNKKRIQETNAQFHVEPLPTITAYRTPIFRIFYNLVNNALKYQVQGNTPEISISYKETPLYYIFSVKDNGIGIEAEYFEKIFVIFQRLHLKDEYSGTGMGLAITKKFVDSLNGEIDIESTPGKGSTFRFSFLKQTE
ncbi:PAS domain-containing protein [Christiangramia aquimixticola]|uniref:PAS domain-containing protein n=1 Tax=Christiangramia aquimixticola TaxID=1697558 RepID=UPI003AA9038E